MLKSRTRLLYLFDRFEYQLYDRDGLQRLKDNIFISDICDNESEYKEYFYEFYIMSMLFLLDILCQNNYEFLLKKILFVSTYYEITKDSRIEEVIDKYRYTDMGIKLYQIIINHDKDVFKSSSYLVKKKNRNTL